MDSVSETPCDRNRGPLPDKASKRGHFFKKETCCLAVVVQWTEHDPHAEGLRLRSAELPSQGRKSTFDGQTVVAKWHSQKSRTKGNIPGSVLRRREEG